MSEKIFHPKNLMHKMSEFFPTSKTWCMKWVKKWWTPKTWCIKWVKNSPPQKHASGREGKIPHLQNLHQFRSENFFCRMELSLPAAKVFRGANGFAKPWHAWRVQNPKQQQKFFEGRMALRRCTATKIRNRKNNWRWKNIELDWESLPHALGSAGSEAIVAEWSKALDD